MGLLKKSFLPVNSPSRGSKFSAALWKYPVECLFLCIYQTYVPNRRWQHGLKYLNGSWCLYSDGYDMTWWAIICQIWLKWALKDMAIFILVYILDMLPSHAYCGALTPKSHQQIHQICHQYQTISVSTASIPPTVLWEFPKDCDKHFKSAHIFQDFENEKSLRRIISQGSLFDV